MPVLPGQLVTTRCHGCEQKFQVRSSGGKYRCPECRNAGRYGTAVPYDATGGAEARAIVNREVRAGRLAPPTAFACADCGKPAKHYDHRDYGKPLQVVAVCHSCNLRRGQARPNMATMFAVLAVYPDASISRRVWPTLSDIEITCLELCGLLEQQEVRR